MAADNATASSVRAVHSPGAGGLLAESVSPLATLFQSVTFMAPAAAVIFSLSIAVPLAGTALPLSVLLAGVACVLAAVALGQLATAIPSAGGLYAYAVKGLGPKSGFMVGWLYVGAAISFPPFVLVLFGWYVQSTLKAESVSSPPWWVWMLIGTAIVFCLTYFGVRLSTSSGVILGAVEICIMVALTATMIVRSHNSLSAFNPSVAPLSSGLVQGAIFGILAFTGFEAASTLGEEARNPRKTIKYSILLSTLIVGAIYVFCSYGWVVGTKFGIVKHLSVNGGNAWNALGRQYWGWARIFIYFAVLNSLIANGVAAVNNAGRVLFSMSRAGSAPAALSRIHPKHRTPHVSIVAVLVIAVVVSLVIGVKFGSDVAWGVAATIFTIFAVCIYLICCAACVSYFTRKEGRPSLNIFLHVVVPVAGILVFLLPLYAQYFDLGGLFSGTLFHLAVVYPYNWSDWGGLAWLALGGAVVAWLAFRKPEALTRAGEAFSGVSGAVEPLGIDVYGDAGREAALRTPDHR